MPEQTIMSLTYKHDLDIKLCKTRKSLQKQTKASDLFDKLIEKSFFVPPL